MIYKFIFEVWKIETSKEKKENKLENANGGFHMVKYICISTLRETWIRQFLHSDSKRIKLLSSELNIDRQSLDIWNGLY